MKWTFFCIINSLIISAFYCEGAGIVAWKDQGFHEDSMAKIATYSRRKLSGNEGVFNVNGKDIYLPANLYWSIDIPNSLPQELSDSTQYEMLLKQKYEMGVFRKRFPKSSVILDPWLKQLQEYQDNYDSGKRFVDGAWMEKAVYEQQQAELREKRKQRRLQEEQKQKEIARKKEERTQKIALKKEEEQKNKIQKNEYNVASNSTKEDVTKSNKDHSSENISPNCLKNDVIIGSGNKSIEIDAYKCDIDIFDVPIFFVPTHSNATLKDDVYAQMLGMEKSGVQTLRKEFFSSTMKALKVILTGNPGDEITTDIRNILDTMNPLEIFPEYYLDHIIRMVAKAYREKEAGIGITTPDEQFLEALASSLNAQTLYGDMIFMDYAVSERGRNILSNTEQESYDNLCDEYEAAVHKGDSRKMKYISRKAGRLAYAIDNQYKTKSWREKAFLKNPRGRNIAQDSINANSIKNMNVLFDRVVKTGKDSKSSNIYILLKNNKEDSIRQNLYYIIYLFGGDLLKINKLFSDVKDMKELSQKQQNNELVKIKKSMDGSAEDMIKSKISLYKNLISYSEDELVAFKSISRIIHNRILKQVIGAEEIRDYFLTELKVRQDDSEKMRKMIMK